MTGNVGVSTRTKGRVTKKQRDKALLEEAFDGLEEEVPDGVTRLIRWVRAPSSRWVRWPLGILCIAASFLWFLPIIGIELLPIGLLLIAQDVPFLRRPVAKLMLWLEEKWRALRAWYQRKRGQRTPSAVTKNRHGGAGDRPQR